MTLQEFLNNRDGKLKRGAISRVAEYLGVSFNCVKRWYLGDWKPGIVTHRKIQDMIQKKISLKPIPTDNLAKYRARKKILSMRKPVKRVNLRIASK